MAKKGWLKAVVGIGAVAVAGKVAYDKLKNVQEEYQKEEAESLDAEVKKYNAVAAKKLVEVEDETFTGCELKAVMSDVVLDLSLAAFEKDVYINFTSRCSNVTIILPEGVNVAVDVDSTISKVQNCVENLEEEGIYTVYIIGKASMSNMQILPINFYVDDDGDFEDIAEEEETSEEKDAPEEMSEKEPETSKGEAELKKDPEISKGEAELEKDPEETKQSEKAAEPEEESVYGSSPLFENSSEKRPIYGYPYYEEAKEKEESAEEAVVTELNLEEV